MIKLIRAKLQQVVAGAVKEFVAAGYGEQLVKGQFLQQYGITSSPRAGADGLVLQIANGAFLIATNDKQYSVEVADGEVAIHASPAVKIHLKADDSIEITGSAVQLTIDGDVVAEIGGAADITANEATITSSLTTLTGGQVKIGGLVTASGQGALCGLQSCLFTGAPHVGEIANNT